MVTQSSHKSPGTDNETNETFEKNWNNQKSYFYADAYIEEQGLKACSTCLTDLQRRAIELRYDHGLSSKEVAAQLSAKQGIQISQANVDNLCSRGLKKMREFMMRDAA